MYSLAVFSQGGSLVSCFLLAGAKSTDKVWVLVSNYKRKKKGGGNTRLGFPPDLKFIAIRSQNLDFLT